MSTASETASKPASLTPPKAPRRRSKWRAIFPLPAGKELGVLVLGILALTIPVVLLEMPVLQHTHGNVLFPLDSAYVNITIARNLAFYQVWGLSKFAFQSAATSLLYPITLAPVFFIMGAHLIIPLIVNYLAAAYFLLMLQRSLIRHGLTSIRQLLILLAVIALIPLPLVVVSGMEYTLQLLFVFLFMDSLSAQAPEKRAVEGAKPNKGTKPIEGEKPVEASLAPSTYLFALLAVAARYEDLIIVLLACIIVAQQKGAPEKEAQQKGAPQKEAQQKGTPQRGAQQIGWKSAAKLAAIAASPIVLFGIISLFKKSYFFPNAMFLDAGPVHVLVLAVIAIGAAAWLAVRYGKEDMGGKEDKGRQDDKGRKEGKGDKQHKDGRSRSANLSFAILTLLSIPFIARNAANLTGFQKNCEQLYEDQYPAAGFVHLYYYKQTVGTNEPGAVSYFSEGRKLDFTGVASKDVVRSKNDHFWSPVYADSLTKKEGVRIAIVKEPWFTPEQLPKWTHIASWDIQSSGQTINFYAINKYDTTRLRKNLQDYQRLLPASVAVRYY